MPNAPRVFLVLAVIALSPTVSPCPAEAPPDIESLTRAIDQDGRNAVLRVERGNAYVRAGRHAEAEEEYLSAIQLDPEGRAGATARKNLDIVRQVRADNERIDALDREWRANIDKAVPFMRQKNYPTAAAYLQGAMKSIAGIKEILAKHGQKPEEDDRLTAMELLTGAYMDMARISGYAGGSRQALARDINAVRAFFGAARAKLTEASAKFHEVPEMQALCRQFLAALDDFERDVKRRLL